MPESGWESVRRLAEKVQAKDDAVQALADAILAEMGAAARRHRLDTMQFYVFTTFIRRGKEVEVPEIAALEDVYLDEVHRCGFHGLWEKGRGWIV